MINCEESNQNLVEIILKTLKNRSNRLFREDRYLNILAENDKKQHLFCKCGSEEKKEQQEIEMKMYGFLCVSKMK